MFTFRKIKSSKKIRVLCDVNNGNSGGNAAVLHTDVSDILIAKAPGISKFMGDALANSTNPLFNPAKNFKHEWLDVLVTPKTYAVASRTGNDVTFTGAIPEVGYILDFTTSSGAFVNASVKVTTIVDTDTVTVELLTGVITNVIGGITANIVSEGTEEGREFVRGSFENGTPEYNYTENFNEGYNISGSMEQMEGYARINNENIQAMFAVDRYLQKLSKSCVRGHRYTSVNSNGKRVSGMGGLRSFVNVVGGNVLSVSTTVTKEDFATLASMIIAKGGDIATTKVYLNPKWAPIVDGFNNVTAGVKDNVRGGFPEYVLLSTGSMLKVEFDQVIPQNEIYFINNNEIALVPLGNRNGYFGDYLNGADSKSRPLIAEYTLELRNAKTSHGVIVIN